MRVCACIYLCVCVCVLVDLFESECESVLMSVWCGDG